MSRNIDSAVQNLREVFHISERKIISALEDNNLLHTPELITFFNTHSYYSMLMQWLKYHVGYMVDDICSVVANNYFEEEVYSENDTTESVVEQDHGKIHISFAEIAEQINFDQDTKDIAYKVKAIISNLEKLNVKYAEQLVEYLSREYQTHCNGMYIDANGDELESEITVYTTFNYSDIEIVDSDDNE